MLIADHVPRPGLREAATALAEAHADLERIRSRSAELVSMGLVGHRSGEHGEVAAQTAISAELKQVKRYERWAGFRWRCALQGFYETVNRVPSP
jgi:hypothetical protein